MDGDARADQGRHQIGLQVGEAQHEVWLQGQRVNALDETERTVLRRDALGFVFQGFNLVPVMTVAENVDYPLFLLGLPLAWKRPFSVEYARLDPREAGWPPALFQRVNYRVSGAWAACLAAIAAADGAVTFDTGLPLYGAIAISIIALSTAVAFTLRYPAHAARQAA